MVSKIQNPQRVEPYLNIVPIVKPRLSYEFYQRQRAEKKAANDAVLPEKFESISEHLSSLSERAQADRRAYANIRLTVTMVGFPLIVGGHIAVTSAFNNAGSDQQFLMNVLSFFASVGMAGLLKYHDYDIENKMKRHHWISTRADKLWLELIDDNTDFVEFKKHHAKEFVYSHLRSKSTQAVTNVQDRVKQGLKIEEEEKPLLKNDASSGFIWALCAASALFSLAITFARYQDTVEKQNQIELSAPKEDKSGNRFMKAEPVSVVVHHKFVLK